MLVWILFFSLIDWHFVTLSFCLGRDEFNHHPLLRASGPPWHGALQGYTCKHQKYNNEYKRKLHFRMFCDPWCLPISSSSTTCVWMSIFQQWDPPVWLFPTNAIFRKEGILSFITKVKKNFLVDYFICCIRIRVIITHHNYLVERWTLELILAFTKLHMCNTFTHPNKLCRSHTKRYTYRLPAVLWMIFLS